MSAIAHLPSRTWAATHRAVLVLLAVLALVAVTAAITVALFARDTATSTPALPGDSDSAFDTCFGAPVGSAC